MQMTETKLAMLLLLGSADEENHTVTGLAKSMELSKAAISKNIDALEEDGYTLRGTSGRSIELTPFGRRESQRMQEEVELCELFLLGGADPEEKTSLKKDAIAMLAHLSEDTKQRLLQRIRRNRIFDERLMEKEELTFGDMAQILKPGEYPVSFVIFKEQWTKGSYYSMSNNGFQHPASLQVRDGEGTYRFHSVAMERRNVIGKLIQRGRVFRIAYEKGHTGTFENAQKDGDDYRIPAEEFTYQLHRGEQLLTGVCRLKFYAPLGDKVMHEKTAVMLVLMKNI